jgi:hypothetical protein
MGTRKRKPRRKTPTRRVRPLQDAGVEVFPYTLPDGRTALYVGSPVRDCDPPAVREGLVRRRLLVTQGRCPCGARESVASPIVPGLTFQPIEHASDCPATEENLISAMRKAAR